MEVFGVWIVSLLEALPRLWARVWVCVGGAVRVVGVLAVVVTTGAGAGAVFWGDVVAGGRLDV